MASLASAFSCEKIINRKASAVAIHRLREPIPFLSAPQTGEEGAASMAPYHTVSFGIISNVGIMGYYPRHPDSSKEIIYLG